MEKFISNFGTTEGFVSFSGTNECLKPHVSLTKDNGQVHFISREMRVVATFNTYNDGERVQIIGNNVDGRTLSTAFTSIEIDGVKQSSLLSGYTFSTAGEHTVKYTLSDVTVLGNDAFGFCNLVSVIIPENVKSIGQSAFYICRALNSITIQATTPPTLGNNALYLTNDCPIYVPSESVAAYKASSDWSSYASRIQAIP
jgi:hypothetical protein